MLRSYIYIYANNRFDILDKGSAPLHVSNELMVVYNCFCSTFRVFLFLHNTASTCLLTLQNIWIYVCICLYFYSNVIYTRFTDCRYPWSKNTPIVKLCLFGEYIVCQCTARFTYSTIHADRVFEDVITLQELVYYCTKP